MLEVGAGGKIKGYDGPFNDDVPGLGDLMDVQVSSLANCAARCQMLARCQSFEYSVTAKAGNCQLASGTARAGVQYADYVLYLKEGVEDTGKGEKMVPLDGFRGPFADDVPGLGDIANVHVKDLAACAARCRAEPTCRSFEYSKTATILAAVRNCQIATGNRRAGVQYLDFVLYVRKESGDAATAADENTAMAAAAA